MKLVKMKKINKKELREKLIFHQGTSYIEESMEDFIDEVCRDGLYTNNISKKSSRWIITFPIFLVAIASVFAVGMVKFAITGVFYFRRENYFIKKLVQWNEYCNFNTSLFRE